MQVIFKPQFVILNNAQDAIVRAKALRHIKNVAYLDQANIIALTGRPAGDSVEGADSLLGLPVTKTRLRQEVERLPGLKRQ